MSLVALMVLSLFASIQFAAIEASASTTDQDGDGLTYGLEYLINSLPNDPDSDNDGLPDGWEWKYGLNPLSSTGDDGAVGDPDGDGMSNLQEYSYLIPTNWDNPATPNVLDNGIWWNGTVPVNNWNEENSMQYLRPLCGDSGPDGLGNTILCDEDPVGNICANGFDDDQDGLVDLADSDGDGDADCNSDDDDGDGLIDEDVAGWDTDGDGMPDGWEAANGLNATSPSNADGPNGDPDGDGLNNLLEYVNPTWNTMCGSVPCFRPGPDGSFTETTSPCDPVMGIGPGGCATYTAEVDGITSTNPQRADSDNDGLNDSYEALVLLTDPTASDTDSDGIPDGVEVNGLYGNPAQASDPRNNNTDGDELDDGEEDNNSNGVIDPGETDPTRKEDAGDADQDGLQNWEENLSCTLWNVADSDFGGVNDGDELNVTHGTDPCDSFIDYVTTIDIWSTGLLTVIDSSGFNPNGGVGYYNVSGTLVPFNYNAVSGQTLVGVSSAPAVGVTDVHNRNGSFCHTSAVAAGTISTTQQYCDDDFKDTDGDGLADWEELLGVYGWFSNPGLVDTDGDGVSDYDEVFDFTDPNEPCSNLLDDDSDSLNNYFEDTIGCDLIYIGINNGSQDVWVTNSQEFDTDSGGVDDRTEYSDGTNPENNPLDDVLPEDFDGDGIPDAIENLTGTDWTNPDTDGGGMLDGDECPIAFWATGCLNSPYDPFDPSDDITSDGVVFWANNTSGVVDLGQIHRWRQNTYDFYTGSTYAHLETVHPFSEILASTTNLTNLPDASFSNSSIDWNIFYNTSIDRGSIPISSLYNNITFWSDPTSIILRSNDTHNLRLDSGSIEGLSLKQEEYFYDWATLAPSTQASQNHPYELILPSQFTDSGEPVFTVTQTVNEVIAQSGATDAYSIANSLSEYLRLGNATDEFRQYHSPLELGPDDDISAFVIDNKIGRCSDYNVAFVTMARLAGIPARYVTGYVGGEWNGNGYTVSTEHLSSWGEVRLEFVSGSSTLDMGWVPFDSCPDSELLEITNQTQTPLVWERDARDDFDISGTFVFQENQTAIPDTLLDFYVVPVQEIANVPGSAATPERSLGVATTDSEGNFSLRASPVESPAPGLYVIAGIHSPQGLISRGAQVFSGIINITDDSVINHTAPAAINTPVVGAGATTVIQGTISYLEAPNNYLINEEDQQIWLSFTSSFNGSNNVSGLISPSGDWSISLELDVTETIGLTPAKLWYGGWVDTQSVPGAPTTQYHLRPSELNITLDIRDAPNLTATVEGPLVDNNVLVVGQDIWVNGTALTAGPNPVDMEGTLVFALRENNTFQPWSQVFNVSVNGNFSVQRLLTAALADAPAGNIELLLRFFPKDIPTTDDANLSDNEPYILRSNLSFQFDTFAQLRNTTGVFTVDMFDHRGVGVDFVEGNFDLSFNGTWFNTTINSTGRIIATPSFEDNLFAGDYDVGITFNGSDFYSISTGSATQRIKGGIGWNFILGQDWTHLGNSTYINGTIFDEFHLTPILDQNITQYAISLVTVEGQSIDLAQGVVDNATSSFNQTITMPTNFRSDAYNIEIEFDFYSQGPIDGPFYASGEPILDEVTGNITQQPTPSLLAGIESEFVVTPRVDKDTSNTVLTNNDLNLSSRVTDLADSSSLEGVTVDYRFDWNNTNVSIGTSVTDINGTNQIVWNAAGIAPGLYEIMVLVLDDLTDPLAEGNSRHTGNFSIFNVTVQANTDFRIDSIPATITAGVDFNVIGQVLDDEDNTRPLIDAVRLSANWLNNENETLVSSYLTTTNGSFNLTVPTDTSNNGTIRGPKTLVLRVLRDSSPFYLESSLETAVFVFGVTQFDNVKPLNAIVVNRGDEVNISSQLVESSNLFQPLSGYDVDVEFRGLNIGTLQTNPSGFANITYSIPLSQPLGLTTVDIIFSGSSDLLATTSTFSTINVRSLTFLVIDPIDENPVAGTSFNISGQVISDNGSGLQQVDGSILPANILFAIDGQPVGFTISGGAIGAGGFWNATVQLANAFEAGNHTIEAAYIPAVNFYLGSNASEQFDSRGYSEIRFIEPALDSQGNPTLNHRIERGNDLDIEILLLDNTGSPVDGQLITVSLNGTDMSTIITTASNGTAYGTLPIPANFTVGQKDLNANYAGIPGTVGLLGSEANTSFVVLAQTNLTIFEYTESLVAGDFLQVNGTLVDDLGQLLLDGGVPSSSVIHLLVDGESVSSVETDSLTGAFSIGYTVPEDIGAGPHIVEVRFYGGRDWVDPIGEGEPSNPEYYMPSSDSVQFNISVPTVLTLLTQTGDVNREDVMTIEGTLLDIVSNPLAGLTIEVYLDGEFMTNVTTDATGLFTAIYPVPADAELGPVLLEVKFNGTNFYLKSDANSTWNIFSHIVLTVDMPSSVAVGQNVTIAGTVSDNQLIPISGHQVELIVEGFVIGAVTTDSNGAYSYQWIVPELFEFGNHTMNAYSGSQGYYRANSTNTTFFLAHRADLTVSFDSSPQITRGDIWQLSGRLYDFDSLTNQGLENEEIMVYLDDDLVATVTTGQDGNWDLVLPATMDLSRGEHTVNFVFAGTYSHLGTEESVLSFVWADVKINIDADSTDVAIRSDGTFGPIEIIGSVSEIGGQGEIFENLVFNVGNGSDCVNQREGSRCILSNMVDITWFNGNFTIDTVAPSWFGIGAQYIHLDMPQNNSLYLNGASVSHPIFIQINVDFAWDIETVVEGGNDEIKGTITITANDTLQGVLLIVVTYLVKNESGGELVSPITVFTDPSGVALIDFNSDPPFGDFERWGVVTLDIQINDPRISQTSKNQFELLRSSDEFSPKYKFDEEASTISNWLYVAIVLIAIASIAGVLAYRSRNRNQLLEEAAEVFAYTAELLAAGDSIREAIFNCYQNVCSVLQQNGFLRRDFETVREFEVAIRQAMPQISDDALLALDNMFEMARYGRDEMGPQHQQAAQLALERMIQEISGLTAIPSR